MRSELKIRITNNESFFGPGTEELFDYIEKTGCVKRASEAMGLSYSKARRMLSLFEKETGQSAVVQKRGGANGGEAELTETAKEFSKRYKNFRTKLEEVSVSLFKECFHG